jgi:superfamily II DNA helicase RecQ
LKIKVLKKRGVLQLVRTSEALNVPSLTKESTIVYAPTRAQVEEVAMHLQKNVKTAK